MVALVADGLPKTLHTTGGFGGRLAESDMTQMRNEAKQDNAQLEKRKPVNGSR
jgi:hypothetical protein